MALDKLTADQIQAHEHLLLAMVPHDAPIGNVTLRARLGWDEALYWDIRNRVMGRGLLVSGRGKGGSVRLVPQTPVQLSVSQVETPPMVNGPTATAPEQYVTERDLYGPMGEVLKNGWAKDLSLDSVIVAITAQQGSKQTGGKWTRPDITVASLRTFPYVPGRHFDVITFEVKPHDQVNVAAVYEALAHLRAATRSYVLLHVPHSFKQSLQAVIEETISEAKQHGVGVIIAEKPGDYDTWEEQVEAVRHEPDPARLNDFLAQQVNQEFREQVIRWLK